MVCRQNGLYLYIFIFVGKYLWWFKVNLNIYTYIANGSMLLSVKMCIYLSVSVYVIWTAQRKKFWNAAEWLIVVFFSFILLFYILKTFIHRWVSPKPKKQKSLFVYLLLLKFSSYFASLIFTLISLCFCLVPFVLPPHTIEN